MAGLETLEAQIGAGVVAIVGDPSFIGIIILGLFTGIVVVQNQRGDGKALGIMGAAILASHFMPVLGFLFMLAFAAILLLSVTRLLTNR